MAIWSETNSATGGARLRGVERTVMLWLKGLPVVLQIRVGGVVGCLGLEGVVVWCLTALRGRYSISESMSVASGSLPRELDRVVWELKLSVVI